MQEAAAAVSTPPTELASARGVVLRPVRRIELLAYLSGAFDLAEQQQEGHAARVAYLAHDVAQRMGFGAEERRRVLYVGLLHDAGVAVRVDGGHLAGGAWVADRFGLDEAVCEAIRATHERWDGQGRPDGRVGAEIPIEGLLVSAAHWACEFTEGATSPLRARAQLQHVTAADIEPLAGPAIAAALSAALRDDETWLALWDDDLARLVALSGIGEGRPSRRRLEQVAAAMGDVIDSAVREPGRARRVAMLARQIAVQLGLPESYCDAIAIAGYLLDIGQLGVPRHITDKPTILTVQEMEMMRRHPGLGAHMLEHAPGLGEVAGWIAAHHERPDGRGYPELLSIDDLPLPPRILAVADAYWALRSERPYRVAFSEGEVMAMLQVGAGQQFDAAAVRSLPAALRALDSQAESDAAG